MNDSAHWLESVLHKAGKTVGSAGLPSSLSLEEAWERASEASGVHHSDLADLVAAFFSLPRASLDEIEGKALKLVPEALAHEHQILPLKEGDCLSHGSAMTAGAAAAFLAPFWVAMVFFAPLPVPLLDILVPYATDAWWLLGIGGAGGFVLNGLARGAFLRSGEEPEKISPCGPSLLERDS